MFSRLKNFLTVSLPQPASDTVRVADRTFNRPVADVFGFRKGMWVYDDNYGVGILTNVYENAIVAVMLVNGAGENKLLINRPAAGLRQARLLEIPEPRRPSAEDGRAFGYS